MQIEHWILYETSLRSQFWRKAAFLIDLQHHLLAPRVNIVMFMRREAHEGVQ